MRRHAFDVLSFVFGTVFLLSSGALVIRDDFDLYGPGLRWLGVGVLVLLGLGLLVGSRSQKEEDR